MKNSSIFLLGFLLIFSLGFSFEALAGTAHNVSGWAWSKNIGWISFNNTTGGGATNYGVHIDPVTGNFSGYAWSENIGWITFNSAELAGCPSGPCEAKVDLENCPGNKCPVSGWARALAHGNGWDGWIKLRGTAVDGSPYGVSIDMVTGEFSGWAWSDMVIGWISFNCNNPEIGNVCPTSNYKVITALDFNQPPDKPGIPPEYPEGETWNHCIFKGLSLPTFHWTYSDPDGDLQTAYEIRVDNDNDFTFVDADEFCVPGVLCSGTIGTAFTPLRDEWRNWMRWNTNYWWIVRVKDSRENWSEWSDPNHFQTPTHAYPWSDFFWSPEKPSQGEVVEFNPGASQTFGGATIVSYLWTITKGEGEFVGGTNAQYPKPKIVFTTLNNEVELKITDSSGFFCTCLPKEITMQMPLPEWKEIAPFGWFRKLLARVVDFVNGF